MTAAHHWRQHAPQRPVLGLTYFLPNLQRLHTLVTAVLCEEESVGMTVQTSLLFAHMHGEFLSTNVTCVYFREDSGDDSSDKIAESRGAKKPHLVWTSELHARFMNAVNHLVILPCNYVAAELSPPEFVGGKKYWC